MKITETRIKLYVKDFESEKHFYQETLGLPIINEWDRGDSDKGVMFDTTSSIIELLTPEKDYTPIQGVDLSLEVTDIQQLWEDLKDKAKIIFPLRDNPWGDTSFCISDPEGFELTFFSR